MKYAKFVAAAALVVGSVGLGSFGLGSAVSEGPEDPSTATEAAVEEGVLGAEEGTASSVLVDGGYMFMPINPYRTWDSRDGNKGRISTGSMHWFGVLHDDLGVQRIPNTAVAVTYNITVTETLGGGGFLAVYPANIDWPGNASVNWTTDGTTVGNGGTTAIGHLQSDGQVKIFMGGLPDASTHYVVDITGYYK